MPRGEALPPHAEHRRELPGFRDLRGQAGVLVPERVDLPAERGDLDAEGRCRLRLRAR